MKDTRKTKLLKSTLNKRLEDFRKFRISSIQEEVEKEIVEKEEAVIPPTEEKPKSKGFFAKILKK